MEALSVSLEVMTLPHYEQDKQDWDVATTHGMLPLFRFCYTLVAKEIKKIPYLKKQKNSERIYILFVLLKMVKAQEIVFFKFSMHCSFSLWLLFHNVLEMWFIFNISHEHIFVLSSTITFFCIICPSLTIYYHPASGSMRNRLFL